MKNLKKLDRKDLKTIAGGGLLDGILDLSLNLEYLEGEYYTCQIQCLVNNIITVKVVKCGSSC